MLIYLLIGCVVVIFVGLETKGTLPPIEMAALALLWPIILFVTLTACLCVLIGRME